MYARSCKGYFCCKTGGIIKMIFVVQDRRGAVLKIMYGLHDRGAIINMMFPLQDKGGS